MASKLLKKAENMAAAEGFIDFGPARDKLCATTFNNMGCLHLKQGDSGTALTYLTRAVETEASLPDGGDDPAATMLNLRATLCDLGK